MHFVTRNSTEPPFAGTFHLKPEIAGFKVGSPPSPKVTHVSHRRQASVSSLVHNLVKPASISIHEEQELRLLDTSSKVEDDRSGFGEDSYEDLEEHDCESEECRRIVINVSGQRYETQLKTLNRLPSTLLGDPEKRDQFWDPCRHEYFFDRHRPSFQAILYYYQSGGRLKRPMEVPVDIFIGEMEFFELGKSVITTFKQSEGFLLEDDDGELPDNSCLRAIWELFEYPQSSVAARVVAIASVLFILCSVVIFCMETMPEYHGNDCKEVQVRAKNGSLVTLLQPNYTNPFFIIETVCILWFVLELLLRAVSCPSKLTFIKSSINWIDFASVLPYFIFLTMHLLNSPCKGDTKSGFFSILRVLRVVRILKLGKHSEGLKILGKTLQISLSELTMFLLFLGIGVIMFSGAIYYAEAPQSNSFFTSIPDAFWWAVVTMTTVGYGDVYPVGSIGKCVGGLCVLSGLLAIALPVPVIVTNFNNIYRQSTGRGRSL